MGPSTNPLRVLHVVSGDLWAGAEAQVAALLSRLVLEPGLTLRVALMNRGELECRLEAEGVGVTVLDESRLSSRAILGRLRVLVREFDPHVVHTHRLKENVLGSLAARLEGRRRSLRTVHGAPEFNIRPWRVDKLALRFADELSARRWQQVAVAVSDELQVKLAESMPGVRLEVIHNGLDEEKLKPLRALRVSRPRARQCRVAFLGRLVPVKRVDLFLAMAERLASMDGPEWRFDLIGDGPLRTQLERLADRPRLSGKVQFHGFEAEAPRLLADCDVLVFTSDHEGTPMAALEALALGVPVVARAVGGLVEMLQDVEGCRLVDSADPTRLAAAVAEATAGPAVPAPVLPARYRIDTCASAYLRLYQELAYA